MKANPRSSSDLEALPPGQLWWVSRCKLIPDVVITFTDVATPTWHYARKQAEIMWRLHILDVYNQRILKDPIQLEKETQEALKLVTTELWTTTR